MKTKTIVMVFVLLLGLLTGSAFASAPVPGFNVREIKSPYITHSRVNESSVKYAPMNVQNIPTKLKSDRKEILVNVTMKYDKENYYPDFICFRSNTDPDDCTAEYRLSDQMPEGAESFSIRVPEGSYWVYLEFLPIEWKYEISTDKPFIHLIKEDFELDSQCTISFDTADAVNRITFNALTPDGEEAVSDLIENEEIIEQGTIKSSEVFTCLYEEKTGFFSSLRLSCVDRYFSDGKILNYERGADILINPVSRRFSCSTARIMMSQEGMPIVTNMGAFMDKSYTVKNNPADYKFVKNEFYSSNNYELDSEMSVYGISYLEKLSRIKSQDVGLYHVDFTTPEIYVGLSDLSEYKKGFDSSYVIVRNVEFCDPHKEIFADISTPPYTNIGNKYDIYNYGDGDYGSWRILEWWPEDQSYRPNPNYSYSLTQSEPVYGNSVPFVSFYPYISYSDEFPDWYSSSFSFGFIGMNGEVRNIDKYAAKLDVKYNGETVCNSMTEVGSWSWGWFADRANRGVYDISVIDENMKVDEMQGCNETDIHFDTSNTSDYNPPVITWMQYRNNEDFVTNSFKEKNGARLLFSAADFEYNIDSDMNTWFTCREEQPTVKVEYAPHGTTEFSGLSEVERPEDFFMPGFGFQYEVALDGISRRAPGGWFDLRVTLTDAAGNYQTQLMSPAFRLEDQSGVETVRDLPEGVRVENGDIIAPEGALIYSTDGLLTDGKGVRPGVYIVRLADRAVKLRVN